jgi:hypothetical protein
MHRSSLWRLVSTEVFRLAHLNLLAVSQKSRSEKEKSGVLCALSRSIFVCAHIVTGRHTLTDCFVSVSAMLAALGGAAAPVMEEPGLRGSTLRQPVFWRV